MKIMLREPHNVLNKKQRYIYIYIYIIYIYRERERERENWEYNPIYETSDEKFD